jgi:predicted nucleic acid-binding protein
LAFGKIVLGHWIKFTQLLGSVIGIFDMILCDTNIFIIAFNGRQDTIEQLDKIGLDEIVLSAVTVMELFQGMGNKEELAQMKKKIQLVSTRIKHSELSLPENCS